MIFFVDLGVGTPLNAIFRNCSAFLSFSPLFTFIYHLQLSKNCPLIYLFRLPFSWHLQLPPPFLHPPSSAYRIYSSTFSIELPSILRATRHKSLPTYHLQRITSCLEPHNRRILVVVARLLLHLSFPPSEHTQTCLLFEFFSPQFFMPHLYNFIFAFLNS